MKQKKDKEQKERDFERLMQEQRQTIYSVCYLFANDRQEADDLAQEVLIRLWQGIDLFDEEEACPAASRLHKRIILISVGKH